MRQEMDREIGSGRLIMMADKNRLPYINAVVNVSRNAYLLIRFTRVGFCSHLLREKNTKCAV